MSILDLSSTESRQLYLVHSKVDYDSPQRVHQIYNLIEQKNYFSSEEGLRYKNALAKMLEGRIPYDCIYCGASLGEHDNLICPQCENELKKRVRKENRTSYEEINDEYDESDENAVIHLDDYLSYKGSDKVLPYIDYEEYDEDDEEADYTNKRLTNLILFILFLISMTGLILLRIIWGS